MSHHSEKVIVVSGSTGKQGGAVARHLLENGWKVRALVRDPDKDAAQQLKQQGAELVRGDLNDRASLDNALKGAYGAFSVQNYWLPEVGFEGEVRQGKLFADTAKAAGVQHFVYTSVGAAHRGMGQKHFESKWIIERYLPEIGLPYTILRPVAFMDNYFWTRPAISNGMFFSQGLRQDKSIQLIASDDIGAVAAIVFANRAANLGKTLELAGDELTEPQIAEELSRVIGRPVNVVPPQQGSWAGEEQEASTRFFNAQGYTADIAAVRQMYPNLRTFDRWLKETGWKDLPVLEMPKNSGAWG